MNSFMPQIEIKENMWQKIEALANTMKIDTDKIIVKALNNYISEH